ncbi:DsbC family protein [Paraburkholderia sp. SIMBA_054]|uniref:DsbC family protein n=1 Tax=Paraburkholderia sp. SIMBA_054 TaxID=3085795 RepID=UPI00397CCF8A
MTVDELQTKLRQQGVEVRKIEPGPIKGLYTVAVPEGIVYVDESGTRLIQGQVFDLDTHANLTQAELQASLPSIDWAALPLQDAIKTVKGDGSRKMVVFSDPDCPYCHDLENLVLPKVDNVTIYTLLLPVAQLHHDAPRKAGLIWCAPDRAKAWDQWMHEGKLPDDDGSCGTPVAAIAALAEKFSVRATPTMVFADGSRMSGAGPVQAIEAHLQSAR